MSKTFNEVSGPTSYTFVSAFISWTFFCFVVSCCSGKITQAHFIDDHYQLFFVSFANIQLDPPSFSFCPCLESVASGDLKK